MGYFIDLLESLGIVKSPYVKQESDQEAWELSKKIAEESLKEAQDAMMSRKCPFGVCRDCVHWSSGRIYDAKSVFDGAYPGWAFKSPSCKLWRS